MVLVFFFFKQKASYEMRISDLSSDVCSSDLVGCSAMAPYRYFADKEALIASIRAQAFRRLADTLDEVSSAGRDEAADVGEAYVRFARANPGAYKLMFDLDQPDERAYPELAAAAARGRKIMARYVEQLEIGRAHV